MTGGLLFSILLPRCEARSDASQNQGGPRRNQLGQVLDLFRVPIARLYSAGELGSMWDHIYQGACNNAEACVSGRIAGRTAAAEKPWG